MNPTPNQSKPKTAPDGLSESNPLWEDAKQTVSQLAGQAGEKLRTEIDSKKELAAEKAGEVASALRDTREALKDVGPLPDLADQAADQIERLADYVQSRNLGDLVREVERFARREPAIFLGASFAVGLLGGRFLKSSGHRKTTEQTGLAAIRFEEDEFSHGRSGVAPLPRMPEPARSPMTGTSNSSSRMPLPSTAQPVPPPMVQRRATQPMAPLSGEARPATKPSTPSGFASPSYPEGNGKTNGNGTNGTP